MATFQTFRKSHVKTRPSIRKSFSEDVFQSVKSLLQSEKELCSVSSENCLKQDEHNSMTEITFLGFNEETDAAHIQDLAAVSLALPDLLNSLHFCSLNENEIICMKDIKKSSEADSNPLNQSHHSGMLCVMRVSPALPRLRIDFIFSLLSKYATGIRYTLETCLRQKGQLETTNEDDDDDTNQSVSSIEDDFVTAFEHLEEEETSKPYNDGVTTSALRSQCDATSQTPPSHHLETHDFKFLVSSGQKKLLAKPSTSLINILGPKELPSVKTSVTTSISEPWIQRSFYRSPKVSVKASEVQKVFSSSSPAYSSESECSSPSPVIFLDEEGYQKSLKAKLELPKIPVTKDNIEDSDSEVSEFFDSFDQFDELEQTSETSCLLIKDLAIEKLSKKKGSKHEKSCSVSTTMNPQKFKFDRPALPANVRKPTPRKPESPYNNLRDTPDSPRPVQASGEDSGLFSPIRSSAFSPLGSCTPADCFCQTHTGDDRVHESHDSVDYTYEDYAHSVSCKVLSSVLHTQHPYALSKVDSGKNGENKPIALKIDQNNKSKNKSLMIKDSIQKFAADLVEKSFGSAFKDLQKGVSSCTNALCHLAIKLTSSVFQIAFNELRRQRAFSLKERAICGLANFLVSDALSNALKDLQYVKKQIFTNTVAKFATDLAEELVFEGVMEVCQFSYPPTPVFSQCWSFDYEDKVVKSYAKDLSESVIQEAFIELSQVDVTFTTKAAVSVSTDNVKYVSAENGVPSIQTFTFSPTFNNQAIMTTKPVQDYRKEYTVQQALFCTSGIVTSIPMPLAGSALLPYHIPLNIYEAKSPLSTDEDNLNSDSTQACITTKSKEEVTCLRNICLPSDSEHNQSNRNELKPAPDDTEMPNSSKLTCDPAIISNFSAAMVHTIVNETLESMTFKVTKTLDEHTSYVTKTVEGNILPFHYDQAALQQNDTVSKDMFADHLSKSIIKHSIDKSKSVIVNTDKNVNKGGLTIPGEESQLTLEKFSRFLDTQDHYLNLAGKDCAPEIKSSTAHGFSSEMPAPGPVMPVQKSDLKELAREKPEKTHGLNNTALEPLSFGQESPFPHSHAFTSTVLTCVEGLHVEDKQKARDGTLIPGTPPSTPLVPSQASSEWDIKKLSKKLKGELAKEFAPATPPSTPHNPAIGSLSENEQNTIEKEEFMLKLMRSLSEEVECSEGEEHSEIDGKLESLGKRVQFAEALATHVISLATEMAASHLDNKVIQEPNVKSPHLNMQSQASVSPAFLNCSNKNLQALWDFAGDMAAEVITEAEKIAKGKSVLSQRRRSSCYADGICFKRSDGPDRSDEKFDKEAHPRELDPYTLSLPPSMSGLTCKYPSCESVTDEYAGHIIQILKQEGGNNELIMDQYANRLVYRSVKSGLQEAARTAKTRSNSQMFLVQGSPEKTKNEPLMFLKKEHQQEANKKRQSREKGSYLCKNQSCERTQDTYRNDYSELYNFSASLANSITREVEKELTSAVGLPKSLTDSCLYDKSGCDEDPSSHFEPEFAKPLQPSSQNHRFHHSIGSLNEYGCGESVQTVEQYAKKIVDDTLNLTLEPAVFIVSETTKSADRSTYAEKLSPLTSQACRYCNPRELHGCTGCSSQHFLREDAVACNKLASNSKLSNICQKSRIFHLDVPQIHVSLDNKTVLAEKIVAEAIENAERELSNTSLAADSGIGQDGISFADSLTTDVMMSAMMNVEQAIGSSKEKDEFQSVESFGSQQLNLSIGEDSTGSWSNLSFEDEHQDESSSFHHLSESNGNSSSWSSLGLDGDLLEDNLSFPTSDSDEPDDTDEEHGDVVEGLGRDGKTLLITNVDMEMCTVDPQLRIILQWLIASEAEVEELYFHDSTKKEFILLSKHLQEKGWRVGDLLQAVLKYYDTTETTTSGERRKSLFDWLLENV